MNASLFEKELRAVIESILLHCHNLHSLLPHLVVDATPSLLAYSSGSIAKSTPGNESEFVEAELKFPLVVDFRIENTCACCGVRFPEKFRTLIYLTQVRLASLFTFPRLSC